MMKDGQERVQSSQKTAEGGQCYSPFKRRMGESRRGGGHYKQLLETD
jgi:hypothetical protein